MRKLRGTMWLILSLIVLSNTSIAYDPDDFLLPVEDSRLRRAQTLKERVDAHLVALQRRLKILEHRYLLKNDDEDWAEKLKKNEPLNTLDAYPDDRLLRDYRRGMNSLLLKVEGYFETRRSRSLKDALRALKKNAEKFLKVLNELEPVVVLKDDDSKRDLRRSVRLTEKAVSGAKSGLDLLEHI